jgi:sugar/nucleoside kinase (ribokinase family)
MTRSDVSSVSTEDLAAGGDRLDRLLPRAGQQLMVTASAHGALHVRRTAGGVAFRRVPAVSARTVADTTGAGDSFHTAWVLSQLPGGPFGRDPLPVGRGLHLAAIVGALAVEGHGLAGLPDRAAVARRIADLR